MAISRPGGSSKSLVAQQSLHVGGGLHPFIYSGRETTAVRVMTPSQKERRLRAFARHGHLRGRWKRSYLFVREGASEIERGVNEMNKSRVLLTAGDHLIALLQR